MPIVISVSTNANFGYFKTKPDNIIVELNEFIDSLDESRKIKLAVELIKTALPVWEKYSGKKNPAYRDSVVWLRHEVDKNLLRDAVNAIELWHGYDGTNPNLKSYEFLRACLSKFEDPLIAIQDDDWKLPAPAEKVFYAVYNLLSAVLEDGESGSGYYVTINQAIDAIDSEKIIPEEKIREIINNFS